MLRNSAVDDDVIVHVNSDKKHSSMTIKPGTLVGLFSG